MLQLLYKLLVSPDFRIRYCVALNTVNAARKDTTKLYNLIYWEYKDGELIYVIHAQDKTLMEFRIVEEKRSYAEIERYFIERSRTFTVAHIEAFKKMKGGVQPPAEVTPPESPGFMSLDVEQKEGQIRSELLVKQFTAQTDAAALLLCNIAYQAGKIMEVYDIYGTVDARYRFAFEQKGYKIEPDENGSIKIRRGVYFFGGGIADVFDYGKRLFLLGVTFCLHLYYKKKWRKIAVTTTNRK